MSKQLVSELPIACVTGATGLIGRYIVPLLLQQGYAVRILSRKPSSSVQASVTHYTGDLCDLSLLHSFLQDATLLFHCAGEVNDPQKMWQVNVQGTENLLKAARDSSIRYFCHISSAGVIGKTLSTIITEQTEPSPRTPYETSKWESEQLVMQGLGENISVVILRPTVVVDETRPGPVYLAMQDGLLACLKRWIKGGEGAYMVHAEDVARAALFFKDTRFDTPACFFVSCDADPWNTVAGIRTMYSALERGITPQLSDRPAHLPVHAPHLLRRLTHPSGLRGDQRFSSQKLLDQGFMYHCNVKTIVQRCIHGGESDRAISEILV